MSTKLDLCEIKKKLFAALCVVCFFFALGGLKEIYIFHSTDWARVSARVFYISDIYTQEAPSGLSALDSIAFHLRLRRLFNEDLAIRHYKLSYEYGGEAKILNYFEKFFYHNRDEVYRRKKNPKFNLNDNVEILVDIDGKDRFFWVNGVYFYYICFFVCMLSSAVSFCFWKKYALRYKKIKG